MAKVACHELRAERVRLGLLIQVRFSFRPNVFRSNSLAPRAEVRSKGGARGERCFTAWKLSPRYNESIKFGITVPTMRNSRRAKYELWTFYMKRRMQQDACVCKWPNERFLLMENGVSLKNLAGRSKEKEYP